MPAPKQTRTATAGTNLAYTTNPVIGNFLVLLISSASSTSPTVSGGGTWIKVGTTRQGGNSEWDSSFCCLGATGGSTTTVTWTVTATQAIIAEYPIIASTVDATNSNTSGGSSTIFSGTISTGQATEFLVGSSVANGGTPTLNSGFTERISVTNNERLALVDMDVLAYGTYSITSSNTVSNPGSKIIAVKVQKNLVKPLEINQTLKRSSG